ncbi:MAG TPA: isocitrate lyase/PEP mutase family protein [Chromatiales bacterium]|nr:isocitrate lyase/PEP mutase family protein [Chromatiales bacterium]
MKTAGRLRELLADRSPVVAPGCYDALTGLLVEQAGFECAYLGGASVSFSRLGRPDVGLVSMTEMADTVANICDRIDIPVIVDADNGFGGALNVQRTVRSYERAGAAAVQLEDQVLPKRCGHLPGKQLIGTAEMLGKLRAARDALHESTLLIARTDAITVDGLAAAMERGAAYAEAGADVLFIESPQSRDELEQIGRELGPKIPLLANMVEGSRTPLLPAAELGELGFSLVIYPGSLVRALSLAGQRCLDALKRDGTTAGILDQINDFSQLNSIIGTDAMLARAADYRAED